MVTKNIYEAAFQNVNILPPIGKSAAPGSRNIYSLAANPLKIPLRHDGSNPYSQIILLTNNENKKGYAYFFSMLVQKRTKDFEFSGSYCYGRSNVLNEITGAQTPITSQWRNVETVNGRNFAGLSTSDNELQHRIVALISKSFHFHNERMTTRISLFYNGQSGNPYSYVNNGSMINDGGNRENYDLIYIPTPAELTAMTFIPITDVSGQILYTTEQQKMLFEEFIRNDRYLRKHRGEFSKRNGARLPFTHILDLRLQHDFIIRVKKMTNRVTFMFDLFNLTNLLKKEWGLSYMLTNDSYPLIRFANYADPNTLTPRYQFIPFTGKPYSLQISSQPGMSPRWIGQLGMKILLNQ